MTKNGWDAAELSRRSGLTRGQVGAYLKGHTEPGIDNAGKAAEALGLTLAELLAGANPPPPVTIDHGIAECARRVCKEMGRIFPTMAKHEKDGAA